MPGEHECEVGIGIEDGNSRAKVWPRAVQSPMGWGRRAIRLKIRKPEYSLQSFQSDNILCFSISG
jgi:hypothetical protein